MQRVIKFRYICEDAGGKMFILFKSITDFNNATMASEFRIQKIVAIDQFTGLQDKNGRDIYEDDIVKFTSPEYMWSNGTHEFTSPIVFREGAFTINLIQSDLHTNGDYIHWREANGFSGAMSFNSLPTGAYFEIIGNIYENPELLNS